MDKILYILWWFMFAQMDVDQRMQIPPERMAYMCGLEEDEFEYFAQVVEAESDGRVEYHDGKLYVAACIWDRINSSYFPDTVRGVLDQSGQFSTTYGGSCRKSATSASRYAILEAYYQLQSGDIPTNILYFNCIGYNYGTAYDRIGDNYFMQYGDEVEFTWNDIWYNTCVFSPLEEMKSRMGMEEE